MKKQSIRSPFDRRDSDPSSTLRSTSHQLVILNQRSLKCDQLTDMLTPLSSEFNGLTVLRLHPWAIGPLMSPAASAVFIDASNWSIDQATTMTELRKLGFRGIVFLLVDQRPTFARLADMIPFRQQDLVWIEKSSSRTEIQAIVRRTLNDRFLSNENATAIRYRTERRYPVDINVVVQCQGRPEPTKTKMTDLSKTGAFIRMESIVDLKAGDSISIRIETKNELQNYDVVARIARIAISGIGIEFLSGTQIQNANLRAA